MHIIKFTLQLKDRLIIIDTFLNEIASFRREGCFSEVPNFEMRFKESIQKINTFFIHRLRLERGEGRSNSKL